MFGQFPVTRVICIPRLMILVALALGCIIDSGSVQAQDSDSTFVEVGRVQGYPGDTIFVPISLENGPDTVNGFVIWTSLSRPDLFTWICDTINNDGDIEYPADFDTSGSIISNWELIYAACPAGVPYNYNVAGVRSAVPPLQPGIPPKTEGLLLYAIGTIRDDVPDTLTDRVVEIGVNVPFSEFVNYHGADVTPMHYFNGTITVLVPQSCDCPHQGDVAPLLAGDGNVNVLDVIAMIDHVFRSGTAPMQDPDCPSNRGDVAPSTPGSQCGDGALTVLDVVALIDHVFRSGPAPCDSCSF